MDFHALPRRDLQALCKRNGVRANMTNVAMANALGELPAVDGIEEYVKQPTAEPTPAAVVAVKADAEEEVGIPAPRCRRVSFNLPDTITREDQGKEKRDEYKDIAPALGLGRCTLAKPVATPATKRSVAASKTEAGDVPSKVAPVLSTRTSRRAVSSKTRAGGVAADAVPVLATYRRRPTTCETEAPMKVLPMATRRRGAERGDVAAEAVPAPVTRERRQRTVSRVAEEKEPIARRATRRSPVSKTDMQIEDKGEGSQGAISDVKTNVPAPVSDEGRNEPVDTAEELNQEDEGTHMQAVTPVEEKTLVAVDCANISSVHEQRVDVGVQLSEDLHVLLNLVEQVQDTPFQDGAGSGEGPLNEEMFHEETETVPLKEEAPAMLKSAEAIENASKGPTALDKEMIHHSSEETEIVPVKEEAQIMLKPAEATENVSEVVLEEQMIHHSSEETEIVPVKEEAQIMLKPAEATENVSEVVLKEQMIHLSSEETETVPLKEQPQVMPKSAEATENVSEVILEEQMIHLSSEETETVPLKEQPQVMPKSAEAIENVSEVVLKEQMIHLSSEETETVPLKKQPQAMPKSAEATENVSEVVLEEQMIHLSNEEIETVPLKEQPQAMPKSDETIENVREVVLEEQMIHLFSEETETVLLKEQPQAMPKSAEATESVSEVPTVCDREEVHIAAIAKGGKSEDCLLPREKESLVVYVDVEEKGVVATNQMPQSSLNVDVEEVVFAVNDLIQDTATHVEITGEECAFTGDLKGKEAGTDHGFLLEEKECLAVDEMLCRTDVAVEQEGVDSSATVNVDVDQKVFTTNNLPHVTATDLEDTGVESAFTGDLPPVLDTGDCTDHTTSPFFARMPDDDTKSVSTESISVEPKVFEEACDVSLCMQINSNVNKITESVAVKQEKGVEEANNESEAMTNLSLRKLRLRFKETMAVGQENEAKECTVIPEPKVSEEADDISLCMYNNNNENKITESVALEQDSGVNESIKSDAMGNLSLRKIRENFKETVTVGQENEVKEGKKSMTFEKLSIRKLKTKLKETLIAHKSREPNRAPLGRLDENVC